jgi:hypothetical protein
MIHWRMRLTFFAVAAVAVIAAIGGNVCSSYW